MVAIVLALLLGGLGIHKFYLGRVGLGILYLLFSWTGIPSLVAWVEAILYLRRTDESWAAEYGGPVRRTSGTAIGCLWAIAIVPAALWLLSMVAIVALLFLGNQVSRTLVEVEQQIPAAASVAPAVPSASTAAIDRLLAEAVANPEDAAALLALADAYYQAGAFEEAGVWLDRVLVLEPDNQQARLARGAAHFNLGEVRQAEAVWLVVAAAEPDNQEVHYDLGFLYLNEDPPDWEGVQREWNRVVAIDPSSLLAQTAAEHLESLAASSMIPASPEP